MVEHCLNWIIYLGFPLRKHFYQWTLEPCLCYKASGIRRMSKRNFALLVRDMI